MSETVLPVRAQAVVDMIRFGSVPLWSVQVVGHQPYDYRRTYDIEARTDQEAAMAGIDMFVEEVENLGPKQSQTNT